MPDPTIVMGPDWATKNNHEAPSNGGWHGEPEVRELVTEGFALLKKNAIPIRSRSATSAGVSAFYSDLNALAQAFGPNVKPWTATVSKGIHQFKVEGVWYMPHVTVVTPYGVAHFWLSIGAPYQLINEDASTVIMPAVNIGTQSYSSSKAGFKYRVAQVSLKEEGPFFPRMIGCTVWTPGVLLRTFLPK